MRATLSGRPPIDMLVRHAPRARRITLRVSGRDGRVTLTVPPGASVAEAVDFAQGREAWLRRVLADLPLPGRLEIGSHVPIEGRMTPIVGDVDGRGVAGSEAVRVRSGRPVGPAVAARLKALARERAAAQLARCAAELDRPTPPLTLRDTRSRWGSCTADGRIMLSWRLAMAPPEILSYVAAHEAAHLVHLDHSPRFWALTERLFPDWRRARRWLRTEGARLQAIDFG